MKHSSSSKGNKRIYSEPKIGMAMAEEHGLGLHSGYDPLGNR